MWNTYVQVFLGKIIFFLKFSGILLWQHSRSQVMFEIQDFVVYIH